MLQTLTKQFLCGYPLNEVSFQDVEKLNLEDQNTLLDATVNSDLVLNYPLKIDYQKVFLKRLLDKLERNGSEIHDNVYSAYARLVALSNEGSECYKHYRIGDSERIISLRENVNLILDGTTGLRTWQASLALCEWCLKNKASLANKTILELGSGVGLTGLVTIHECQPSKFYFTDCHPTVLQTLAKNIKLNNDNNYNGVSAILNLSWENVDERLKDLGKVDWILAADVVYDKDLFHSLIGALKSISQYNQVGNIVFACTERNADTLKQFLGEIEKYFEVTEEGCPSQTNFIWSPLTPVRIFKFKLSI